MIDDSYTFSSHMAWHAHPQNMSNEQANQGITVTITRLLNMTDNDKENTHNHTLTITNHNKQQQSPQMNSSGSFMMENIYALLTILSDYVIMLTKQTVSDTEQGNKDMSGSYTVNHWLTLQRGWLVTGDNKNTDSRSYHASSQVDIKCSYSAHALS